MASGKNKRKRSVAEAGEQSEPRRSPTPTEEPERVMPSGHPFINADVEWVYQREHLASKPHKVIPGGYEKPCKGRERHAATYNY